MRGDTYDVLLLWAAASGQVAFVSLWASQRWWTSNVGRALMAKSSSLALILVVTVVAIYFPVPLWLERLLFTLVTATILGQLGTLAWEVSQARREQRRVSGTDRRR